MINVLLFAVTQIAVQLLFKGGCESKHRALCFALANIISAGGAYFLMAAYRQMNPNLAFGLCVGAAFLLSQLALSIVFMSRLTAPQWTAVMLIGAGLLLFSVSSPPQKNSVPEETAAVKKELE
jgi:multidrug transporter EmrE-like cation transporter